MAGVLLAASPPSASALDELRRAAAPSGSIYGQPPPYITDISTVHFTKIHFGWKRFM
jgi:hypothetical protein